MQCITATDTKCETIQGTGNVMQLNDIYHEYEGGARQFSRMLKIVPAGIDY